MSAGTMRAVGQGTFGGPEVHGLLIPETSLVTRTAPSPASPLRCGSPAVHATTHPSSTATKERS